MALPAKKRPLRAWTALAAAGMLSNLTYIRPFRFALSTTHTTTLPYLLHSSVTSSWMSRWKSGSFSLAGSNMLTSRTVSAGDTCVGGRFAPASCGAGTTGGGKPGGGRKGARGLGMEARSVLRASFAMSAARDWADTCTPPSSVSSSSSTGGPMPGTAAVVGGASMTTWTLRFCPARSNPLRCATAFCPSASALNSTIAHRPPSAPGSRCTLAERTLPKGVKSATRSSSEMSGCRLPTETRVGFSCCAAAAAWEARRAAWFFSAWDGWMTMGKPHTVWPDFITAAWQYSMLSNST
mmetsp:Transcript_27338/g.56833  ORF Transcript_27338/g.56833 Transcript_27338/m.56833 type:complete len:295 (+) Transcript_27338:221-1105(+)